MTRRTILHVGPAPHKEAGFSLCCDRSKFLAIGVCVHTISGMEITFDAV